MLKIDMKAMLDNADAVAIDWPIHRRLMMVIVGYVPFGVIVLVIVCAAFARHRWGTARGLGCGIIVIYLFPPLAQRIQSVLYGAKPGRHAVASSAFLRWWLSAQWQVIFNRLPILEELLRLIPGLYSAWLRLWGAKVGSLIYWSPGVAILDRPFLLIGSRVVFGAGVRLNPHVIVPGKGREAQLWLSPVTLGDDSLIGGYSLITAGCKIPAGVSVPAGRYLRPFSNWQDNQSAQTLSEGDPN